MLLNYTKNGRAWTEHGIKKEQVIARNTGYFEVSDSIGDLMRQVIEDAAEKGWLKK